MIPNQWYAILESSQVPNRRPIGVTRMGEKLVLWRDPQGLVTCMSDLCPHRGVALSKGKLTGGCLECPFHGFQFDTTGACRLIPANGRSAQVPKAFQVHTYPTREAHGFIYIWWGEPRPDLPALPYFDSIPDSASYSTVKDLWHTHYSRAIENQLDVVHLPFIHRSTIGRGNKTLVNGPLSRLVEMEGCSDRMDIWVSNQVDQGQAPLKASEIPIPQRHPSLQFRFPNLWHNWISDQIHLVVAFAPVDDEHTLLYLRMYQTAVRTPGLQRIFDAFGALGNLVIERQDKWVVATQRPYRTSLRMGEKLIPGDGPIVMYRRRREELIKIGEAYENQASQP